MNLVRLVNLWPPFEEGILSVDLAPTSEGLEFTLPENRMHFSLSESRMHYTLPRNRMHFTIKRED